MTPAQRAALDALPPKRRAFVLAYVETGNATEAARRAKYAKPKEEGSRLLTFAAVRRAVDALRVPVESAAIASIDELRAIWTSYARGEMREGKRPVSARDRLKASELLGKSQGAFVERREVSGAGGGPIEGAITIVASRDEVIAAARDNGGASE